MLQREDGELSEITQKADSRLYVEEYRASDLTGSVVELLELQNECLHWMVPALLRRGYYRETYFDLVLLVLLAQAGPEIKEGTGVVRTKTKKFGLR